MPEEIAKYAWSAVFLATGIVAPGILLVATARNVYNSFHRRTKEEYWYGSQYGFNFNPKTGDITGLYLQKI